MRQYLPPAGEPGPVQIGHATPGPTRPRSRRRNCSALSASATWDESKMILSASGNSGSRGPGSSCQYTRPAAPQHHRKIRNPQRHQKLRDFRKPALPRRDLDSLRADLLRLTERLPALGENPGIQNSAPLLRRDAGSPPGWDDCASARPRSGGPARRRRHPRPPPPGSSRRPAARLPNRPDPCAIWAHNCCRSCRIRSG